MCCMDPSRASVCKKETKDGSAARPQNRSICRADIILINDISRCLEVSETTFMPQLLRGFVASCVYSINISHGGNAWCHFPPPGRGQDRTGRSKITHYRRINAAGGTLLESRYFFWNVSAALKWDGMDFHQHSKDQRSASWNCGGRNNHGLLLLYIRKLVPEE